MITYKSDTQLEDMKEGGKRLKEVLEKTLERAKPGISTFELDAYAESLLLKRGGEASFKRVPGYTWATCMCLNDCIVHGVPKKEDVLQPHDVLTIDVGMFYKGLNTDTSWTIYLDDGAEKMPRDKRIVDFLETGKRALSTAINTIQVGRRVGHISQAIEDTIAPKGYGIAEELIGHGIGADLHEDPEVPGLLQTAIKNTPRLESGMTLAIEAIYMMGSNDVYTDEADGWTIRTKDGTIASCFEKTIALTDDGVIVLT